MGILRFLQDKRFDIFFSVILGIGIICILICDISFIYDFIS